MKMNPAEYVIHVFGGVRSTARLVGRAPATVCAWKRSRTKGGGGGFIPSAAQRTILDIAKKLRLPITPNDLAYGRTIKKPKK